MNKSDYRNIVKANLGESIRRLNDSLKGGKNVKALEPLLKRLGRGGELPHWYEQLQKSGSFPNLDGKSVGSVIEMMYVSVLELYILKGSECLPLELCPAKGVDIPGIDLGIKSPSTNFCTSEPFYSAYERILGNAHDMVILLTDYQDKKSGQGSVLQISAGKYLAGSEIADKNLCKIASHIRDLLKAGMINDVDAKKCLKFLSYVIQSDWLAKQILNIMKNPLNPEYVKECILKSVKEFGDKNRIKEKKGDELISESDLKKLERIKKIDPIFKGVIDVADEWVIETHKDFARIPNDNEWGQFLNSPLNGKIGMSFALQWRYNFKQVFPDK